MKKEGNLDLNYQNLLQLKVVPPAVKTATVKKMDAQLLCVDPTQITPNTLLYLDPPYNQRQYGANYFPLNAIADIYDETLNVTGVTGLPQEGYKKSGWKCPKPETKKPEVKITQSSDIVKQPTGDPYEYKKTKDGRYYTKKKTSDKWIDITGTKFEEPIKRKVFKEI